MAFSECGFCSVTECLGQLSDSGAPAPACDWSWRCGGSLEPLERAEVCWLHPLSMWRLQLSGHDWEINRCSMPWLRSYLHPAVVPIIANNKVYTYSLNVEVQARQTMIQAGTWNWGAPRDASTEHNSEIRRHMAHVLLWLDWQSRLKVPGGELNK